MNTVLTPHSTKGLNSLSIIVEGSGIQVFVFENDIFRWVWLQATCFLDKGKKARTGTQILDFTKEGGTETSRVVNTL